MPLNYMSQLQNNMKAPNTVVDYHLQMGLFLVQLLNKYFFSFKLDIPQAVICVVASQIANFVESYIGAVLQDKEDFQWVSIYFLPNYIGHLIIFCWESSMNKFIKMLLHLFGCS